MASVYQRKSDGRWVAAISVGPRGARITTARYASTREEAEAKLAAMGLAPQPATLSERFWQKVAKGDGCWEWQGVRVRRYGVMWDGERRVGAHRFAYQDAIGPIPDGLYVCHRCDNPPCVRPDHLYVGDQTDNMRDMVVRGRGRPRKNPRTVWGTVNGPSPAAR